MGNGQTLGQTNGLDKRTVSTWQVEAWMLMLVLHTIST